VLVPLPTAAWAGLGMMGGVVGMAYIRRRKQQA
jgi:LPXTG-motif cell wall-anchored protein